MNAVFVRWSLKWQGAFLACLMLLMMGVAAQAAVFPLTITANNNTKVYGTPITFVTANTPTPSPDYTVTGSLQPGDTVDAVTLTSDGAAAAAPVSGSPYTIVPSAAVMTVTSGNTYTITYVNGSMTVTARAPTLVDPAYRRPILMPESQAATVWTNIMPNALADYYTYVPFTNADAVALGFPATCGNPTAVGATAADLASTEDCYTISTKKFQQGFSLPAAWGFGGNGLINPATGLPYGPITWAFGYGSGGAGWVLPYYDTTKPGVVASTPVTGNAPTPFANGTLASTGIWHFPAPSIKGTKGRPVRVQFLNELPNEIMPGFDPTLCGDKPSDCFPYNRIVVHVHGSHVGPESDGQVHAWFTPGFTQVGPLFESTRQHGPEGTYYFAMDQEAGTIWYHDHATGVTHLNVNMGTAGFFPITDANEKALQTANILPTGARELGFALQDRVFYDDGQQAMPDAPILDPLFAATCTYTMDPVTGDKLVTSGAGTCSPVFMKAPDGHLVPYPAVPPIPAPPAYLATSSTLEFFGNIPVVNGVTYGKYNVDRGVYRIRFLGGTDSRTWALRLRVAGSNPARYLPFWQIASEQGLLNNPVKKDNILIMAGERVDVLVDFNSAETLDAAGVSAGPLNLANMRIIVENWAGDAPYGGEPILPASDPAAMAFRSADIPEVMAFDVSAVTVPLDVIPPSTATALRPSIPPVPNPATLPPAGTPVRTVSLVEIVDQWQRIMPTLDGRGFLGFAVSELPKLNTTEQWDIINTTVDAHPIHLHQVAFQLINRETIAATCPTSLLPPLCVTPASTAVTGPYTPAVVTAFAPASLVTPLPDEIGYKDTILAPPGVVTRVIATFDIPGTYVWHCHILSHEEHDMMRPLVVTTPATSVTLNGSSLTQPTGATMTPVTLTAQAFTGIAAYPVGHGFEYDFTVTGPAHAPIPGLPQPTRATPAFNSSMGDTFNVVNVASWTPPTTPGSYTITASTKAMGPVGAGNPIVSTTANFIVSNAVITIDPASLTVTYDGTPKAVTILPTTPPGLTVIVTYNGSATPPTNAGSYSVVATVSDPTNTSFGTASATLVITPAALTVTANNQTKVFGTTFTFIGTEFTATGLLNADQVTSVTLTSAGAAASATVAGSPYPIVPSAAIGTGLANYTITYVNGSMAVIAQPQPLVITTTTLPGGYVGTPYSQTLAATGGVPPYTWTVSAGTLPTGLALSSAGVISGTPTAVGTFSFTVMASDSIGSTPATQPLSITVAAALPPIVITTTTLPGGNVGTPFNQTLAATGGVPPYTWSVSAGTLPTGLALSSAGVISGTPTATGTFNFTVMASDSLGSTPATQPLSITIAAALPPVVITTTTLPGGNVGAPYNRTLAATGGMPPYTWTVSAGALPPGLALSSAGVISGTPTAVGTFSFTVMASDSLGNTPATQALSITIAAPLPVTITTSTLPGGAVGVPYSQELAATGGVQPYTWARISGTLPPGLTLSSAGVISGTPTAAGNFTFTVRVTAANGATATKGLSIVIASAPPAAPTILTAAASSTARNMVSWIDHSNNETGFTVWCSVNGAEATKIATVLSTASETRDVERVVDFYHTGISKRNTYTYYVMAFNALGASAPSNSATASYVLPTAPTLTSVTAVRATKSTDKVTISWTPVANATSYTVQRANNATFTNGVSTTAGLQALFTSTTQTVSRNRTFYYRVKAVNGVGSSGWSNVKSVVTP